MTFPQRLRGVIGDMSVDQFAAFMEEPAHRVTDILREKQKPPADFLIKLHAKQGVDLNWLLTGEGGSEGNSLSLREIQVVEKYRAATDEGRTAIEQICDAVAKRSVRVQKLKKVA